MLKSAKLILNKHLGYVVVGYLDHVRKYIGGFIGTFAPVFAGTGAIVSDSFSKGAITHPGFAPTLGLIVMSMIYAGSVVSGAHLNPTITLASSPF